MKTSFILLSQSRSGSTLLKELIDSHPGILCDGELFGDDYFEQQLYLKLWKKIPFPFIFYRRFRNASKAYGFKLFLHHLPRPGRTIHILHKMGWKIIYLRRNDVIEQVFSAMMAKKTDRWHRVGNEAILQEKQFIPVDRFVRAVKGRIMWRNVEENILEKIPHLSLSYEEKLKGKANWQKSLEDVFEFLDVQGVSVQSEQKKMYSRPYYEFIENYDDLIKALENNNLNHLLSRK